MRLTPGKIALSLTAALGLAVAPSAFAGHGHWHHGGWHDRGGWHHHDGWRDHDGWRGHRGHYDHFGRWVAGAVVAGALTGLVIDATSPHTVYYDAPPPPPRRVYREYDGPTVIYEDSAPVVIEHRYGPTRVYSDPYDTRYIGDDGWDDDDGD